MNFAVLGSAHLDILGRAYPGEATLDRPGDVDITYGGTGFNIAVNLAALGHSVAFGTVLADKEISRTIVHALQQAGINARVDYRKGLKAAAFLAHVAETGELMSAISSCPVEEVDFLSQHLASIMEGADAVILECNLAIGTLVEAGRMANEAGRPLWLGAVSEVKGVKILEMMRQGVRMSGIFLNQAEVTHVLRSARPPIPSTALLAELMGCLVVETLSGDGVYIWEPGSVRPVHGIADDGSNEGQSPRERQHWLGAGDHLLALTLHRHLSFGESVSEAACHATRHVTAYHGGANCNLVDGNPLEERLAHLTRTALHDKLTGLLNRAGLEDFLAQHPPSTAAAVVMADLDHFKRINDTYGHQIGDEVLAGVGNLLGHAIRASDAAVRFGGEEMILILPHCSLDRAAEIAERVRENVEAAAFRCGKVTCSLGVAVGSLGDLKEIEKRADAALYRAKHGGRNQVCRDEETVNAE